MSDRRGHTPAQPFYGSWAALLEAVAQGDQRALALARTFAGDLLLPDWYCRAHRDSAIRAVDAWLRANVPDASENFRARFISKAGRVLRTQDTLAEAKMFSRLEPVEREHLAALIRPIACSARWPGAKRIKQIAD